MHLSALGKLARRPHLRTLRKELNAEEGVDEDEYKPYELNMGDQTSQITKGSGNIPVHYII